MRCDYSLELFADCLGQLGVMKALWARELIPSKYVASGIGAALAGLAACGWEPRDIEGMLFALRRNAGALFDIDWQGLREADALLYGRRVESLLSELTSGVTLGAFGNALALIAARNDDDAPVMIYGGNSRNVPLSIALRACIADRGVLRPREVSGVLLRKCDGHRAERCTTHAARNVLIVDHRDWNVPCRAPRISLCDDREWLEASAAAWRDAIRAGEIAAASMADELACLFRRD